jgi:hypothetical protein
MQQKPMILIGSVLGIIAIAFFGALQVASHQVISALPEKTRSCLPRQGVALAATHPQLLAEAQSKTVDYHLYHLQEDAHEYVVTVGQDSRCKLLRFSAGVALSSQIPLSVSKQLTLAKMKKAIARVGKSQFERQMQQAIQASPDKTFSPEMRWAIAQLGLM